MNNIEVNHPKLGNIKLYQTDYLSSGGEGDIYIKNNLIFKIWHSSKNKDIINKLNLLSKIKYKNLIVPIDFLYNRNNEIIGYTMYLIDGEPIIKTFNNNWRQLNAFGLKESTEISLNMREIFSFGHSNNIVFADANEFNWITKKTTPYLIDCDSWKIDKYPATAIMPSIKDYKNNEFNIYSDWFAWAIVTFQIFTGIHPYKGSHPNYKKSDLKSRMMDNISVFDKNVSMPNNVRNLNNIPKNLLDWYFSTFQNGERSIPPKQFDSYLDLSNIKHRTVVESNSSINHDKLFSFEGNVLSVNSYGLALVKNKNLSYIFDLIEHKKITLEKQTIDDLLIKKSIIIKHNNIAYIVKSANNKIYLTDINNVTVSNELNLNHQFIISMNNKIYVLDNSSNHGLIEINIKNLSNKTIISVKENWPVLIKSSIIFDNCLIYYVFNKPFVVIPYENGLIIKPINTSNIKNIQWAYAVSDKLIAIRFIDKDSNTIEQFIEIGNSSVLSEDVVEENIGNIIVLNNLIINIKNNGIITFNHIGHSLKFINDSKLNADTRLFKLNNSVCYFENNHIYKISATLR